MVLSPATRAFRAARFSSTPVSQPRQSAAPGCSRPAAAATTRAAAAAELRAACCPRRHRWQQQGHPRRPPSGPATPTSRAASSSTSRCSSGTTTTGSAPAVAEAVEPSADAKTWTIKLRQGVTFHNGKDVTPEDVLSTIQRVADPRTPTSAGVALAPIIDLDGTKKVDDTTVVIKLKTPYAVLDYLLAEYTFGIVPADYDPKNPVGTGAFKYKSFTPGKNSVFTQVRRLLGRQGLGRRAADPGLRRPQRPGQRAAGRPDPDDRQPALQPDRHGQGPGRQDHRVRAPAPGCRSRCGSTPSRSPTCASARRCG